MLFIAAIGVLLVAVLITRYQSSRDTDLGWMSEQWLAAHRTSRYR